jgi:glutamate-1-semialdehyde 2,1-aminomutase
MRSQEESLKQFERAKKVIPGGLNGMHRYVDPPLVFNKAKGSRIYDVDGNEYIDYHNAYSPVLLGHCYPKVQKAVKEAIDRYDLFGAGTTDLEIKASEKIAEHVPSVDSLIFCNSGTEATYHAVRLARAVTGRDKIIKFQGCYHGFHDYLGMNIISPKEKIGKYDLLSAGIPQKVVEDTLVLPFNDLDIVEETVNKENVAMIILEPIPHNIGCLLPKEGYLAGLRKICDDHGIILVFDEVITGFRHHIGGLQAYWNVIPDVTTLGKGMANGYPLAAIGGKAEYMNRFQSAGGDVFCGGTFSSHPAAMAAILACIDEMETKNVHEHIFALGERMRQGMKKITEELGLTALVTGFGSAFLTYFMDPPLDSYTDLLRNDAVMFVNFRKEMIKRGFFMMPINLKRCVVTFSHTEEEIDRTLDAAREVLTQLKNKIT